MNRRWPTLLIAGGCLGLGLLCGWGLQSCGGWGRSRPAVNPVWVLRQVQTLSHWVTVKYVMERVVVVEDATWLGENRLLLLAHGVVKAGVDFQKLDASSLSIHGDTVEVTLPAAEITDAYLDEHKTQVIERSTGLLRTFDKDFEQNARRQAIDDIRRAAWREGILHDARERARWQLEIALQQMGFRVVTIKQKD